MNPFSVSRLRVSLIILALATPIFGQQIGDTALDQIRTILQSKTTFTSAQNKMSSDLVFALKMSRNELATPSAQSISALVALPPGPVAVDLKANVTDTLLQQIAAAGGTIVFSGSEDVRATLPLSSLEGIATLPGVLWLRTADQGITNNTER